MRSTYFDLESFFDAEKSSKAMRVKKKDLTGLLDLSGQELAKFWDTHDITDFFDELEEISEPVFLKIQ